MQNFSKHRHKHFKRKQLPFRSQSSQAFHWHAKESKNNLVISFSDDDSSNDSKDCYSEQGVKRLAEIMPNKVFATGENDTLFSQKNPIVMPRESLELGHVHDSTTANYKLEILRHEIVAKDVLKAQQKPALQINAKQHEVHVMNSEDYEPPVKQLKCGRYSSAFSFCSRSNHSNDIKFRENDSCDDYQPEKDNILLATDLQTGALSENLISAKILKKPKKSKVPSNYTKIAREGSLSFRSLARMEELHEKELEEAQEHRRKCELEERRTLKAYRKSQRSLAEANKKCAILHKNREVFSAKFRAMAMEVSNSISPPNWLSHQIVPHEDQLLEPDARSSSERENGVLDEVIPLMDNSNLSTTNDDEENFCSGNQVVKSNSTHEDYELEASLRSELVARLGLRASSKTSNRGIAVEKGAGGIKPPSPRQKMMPSFEAKQFAKLDGIEGSQAKSCPLTPPIHSNPSTYTYSNRDLHSIAFPLDNSSLRPVCRHAHIIFPECHIETYFINERDKIVPSNKMGAFHVKPNIVKEVHLVVKSVEIDPFWPLCMFEFRGKCNDEQCPWQHMKPGVLRMPRLEKRSSLPIPTYQIGPYAIKADSHFSSSVLARSNWEYRQRGFCASFSIPFCVQRILPIDAPCLRSSDDPVADDNSWNWLTCHHHRRGNGSVTIEDSGDIDQVLEMVLDHFDGEFCEPDRKKSLILLAHAIESNPSSEVLWVVYLHIFYRNEKALGKDDMFLHAVLHNKGSYDLWLLFINSRKLCEDRSTAYDQALNSLCCIERHDGTKHFSSYILDIFLQKIDFLCMSDRLDKAISQICELFSSNQIGECNIIPLRDICECLTVPDRCIFWASLTFFLLYEKLPDAIVQQFELAKVLPFELDWPPTDPLPSDRKFYALELMKLAMCEMLSFTDDIHDDLDQASLRSMHSLAVSHVKCTAALCGPSGYAELLDKYLKLYPSCVELTLLAVRLRENYIFSAFEEAICHWPKESPGIQCLWNQFAERILADGRIDLAEKLLSHWHDDFSNLGSMCDLRTTSKDNAFGFLNQFLYFMLRKNSADARLAIDTSLELAGPKDYNHFAKEHALFVVSSFTQSPKHFPAQSLSSLLNRYIADPRSRCQSELLHRKFITAIKKPKIQNMINHILGPVSNAYATTNSVLEACYGTSLLPEKLNVIKEAAGLGEFVMETSSANYVFALSMYRVCSQNLTPISAKFWACSLLLNSLFQAVPVAPEHVWLEAANAIKNSEELPINLMLHKHALSVHPFSLKLWRSYMNLPGDSREIIEAARERGVELNDLPSSL